MYYTIKTSPTMPMSLGGYFIKVTLVYSSTASTGDSSISRKTAHQLRLAVFLVCSNVCL